MLQEQPITPTEIQSEVATDGSMSNAKLKHKEDALTLAKLLYRIYKSQNNSARIKSGQNND
jgi:hypothetical protein